MGQAAYTHLPEGARAASAPFGTSGAYVEGHRTALRSGSIIKNMTARYLLETADCCKITENDWAGDVYEFCFSLPRIPCDLHKFLQ